MNNPMINGSIVQTSAHRHSKLPSYNLAIEPAIRAHWAEQSQNDLLAALPKDDLDFLLPHLELIELPAGKELYEYGRKYHCVFFPTTAIVSLLYVTVDGATTEIAVVGHEGGVGLSLMMGDSTIGNAVVQSGGWGYRIKAQALKEAFTRGGALPLLLMRYNHALFSQMAQNAVSSRHYSIEQQLCRWLLDRLDRLFSNELHVTQEFIASMLGVRRESVTEAARNLQLDGFIQYKRGKITVINRAGLEERAGECYQVAKDEFDLLLAQSSHMQSQ
jgi:CRP-like cAMP-binding protein